MANKVYLVGAGPGSPDLITLKGLEILRQADVLIYDYLVDKRILAEAKEGAELICCDTLGKNRYSDGFLIDHEKISNLVIKKAKEGKKVIRLKNGDPSIFSRTSQELEALVKQKIEFEIVPGVSAASAAASFSGIPLTDRRFASSLVFVTGHEDPVKKRNLIDYKALAEIGSIVLYMAVENIERIAAKLIKAGKKPDTPAAIVQDASLLTQKVLLGNLNNIASKAREQKIRPPAIIIIGEAVKLEKEFNWLKKSKRILFTGISARRYFEKGIFFHLPLIKIAPLKDYRKLDRLVKGVEDYDWLIFLSRYGVEYFFQRLNKIGYDARRLQRVKIAAIGNSTRNRLLDFGLLADLVPEEESSRGLLKEFKQLDIRNKKIFLPRSDISDKGIEKELRKLGAKVASGFAYRNVFPENLPDLDLNYFDEVMFTSPSGVRNFAKRYGKLPKKIKVSCIGEVTLNEAKRCRLSG